MKVTGGAAELGLGMSKTGTVDEEVLPNNAYYDDHIYFRVHEEEEEEDHVNHILHWQISLQSWEGQRFRIGQTRFNTIFWICLSVGEPFYQGY